MTLTAEELAIYGLIDAETYIQLTEAIMAGSTTVRNAFRGWTVKPFSGFGRGRRSYGTRVD